MRLRLIAAVAGVLAAIGAASAQDGYTFDPSEYQSKAFEFGGYAEGKLEGFDLDKDSVFYGLAMPAGKDPDTNARWSGTLEFGGKYHLEMVTLDFLAHGAVSGDSVFGEEHTTRLYQGGVTIQPVAGLTFDIGKRVQLWGKGYAWNPVGFIQRPKDPTDPDVSREGFWMGSANYVRSFQGGPVQTAGLSLAFIPTTSETNSGFGKLHRRDLAAKLYLLAWDTDIDFMLLSNGAKSFRYGVDFSRNIGSQLEVHGEIARIRESERTVLDATDQPVQIAGGATSYLLGLRYLTESDTTYLLEYYHNGEGFRESEAEAFYAFAHGASGNPPQLAQVSTMSKAYMRPNPMRDYVNLKVSQKEPFDIVYFTPSLTVQANLNDGSALVLPEVVYTGFTNLELRLRLQQNIGPLQTEFGEKQASTRVEFRLRYYF